MLTRDDLVEVLAAITVTAPVRSDEVTPSTNATAVALAEAGEPEWTLVATAHQTEGKGRLGRSWSDVADGSLLFSFVLRPELTPARTGLLSLLAGAEMANAIRATTGRRVTCKWPNDLILHDAKVGGVLLEASVVDSAVRYVVVCRVREGSAPPLGSETSCVRSSPGSPPRTALRTSRSRNGSAARGSRCPRRSARSSERRPLTGAW